MRKGYLITGVIASVLAYLLFGYDGAGPARGQAAEHRHHGHAGSTPAVTRPPKAGPAAYFTPKKLLPGQRPPQFVVLSFDGVGWHEKWQYWNAIAAKVPMRFTGFLTGLYLVDSAHASAYHGPGHAAGTSSLGAFPSTADLVGEITDLNSAWSAGDEIGTHYNGHFCDDNRPGADDWTTADWNSELDQFFDFVKNYKIIDAMPAAPTLRVPADSITSERTPCLEGKPAQLFPALAAHHFTVDASVTRRGLAWPRKQGSIWQMGMAQFPLHGTSHFVTTMDYNFWYTQEHASGRVPAHKSAQDSAQILATYQDMYAAAYQGNRAPLFLGNHFESWNNNAYTQALGRFALAVCGKPDTYCVPFHDVVSWLNAQDPATLARLQALPPELAPR